MNGIERRTARILIALSADVERRLALDVYRYLLGDAPPRIVGLLVEDPRLIAHARSALAREIVLSGLERRLEPESLERELRARWSSLRRLFETEGERLGIEAELEIVREERRAALAKAVERADALVVDRDAASDALALWSGAASPGLRALLLAPPRWPSEGEIVVLADASTLDSAAGGSNVEVGLRLARRTGAPLTILVAGNPGEAAEQRLARLARLAGVRLAAIVRLHEPSLAALAGAASHARVLVLPPDVDPALAAALAARLRGATVLWRTDAAG